MRMKWRGALVLLAAAVGCDDSVVGGEVDAGAADDVGGVDGGTADAGRTEAGAPDVGAADAGTTDVGAADAGATDAAIADVGIADVGIADVGIADVGIADAGTADVGIADAGDAGDAGEDTGPSCATATCGGACVDTQTDANNCGSCGHACCAGTICLSGICNVVDCGRPGVLFCGTACTSNGGCFDPTNDVSHCGGCDIICPAVAGALPSCAGGACGFVCGTTRGDCDATAATGCETDLAATAAHCGACGHACGAGQGCTAGACVDLPCDVAGQMRCGGVCTDRRTAVANCGACGTVCPAATGASAVCVAGACAIACNAGLADCDAATTNGCETDLTASATSCGRCGATCGAGLSCASGHCERTTCLPPAASATAGCTRVAFSEDWESGTARWNLPRGGTTAITTANDDAACAGRYLRETERYSAGRVFTRESIPVTGGARYCVTSWIRGSAGTWPFVGMRASTPTAALGNEHWLIGQPCFSSSLPPPVAPVIADGTWRWYAREFTMPAYTNIVLEIEIWDGGAAGTADFDQVQVLEGPCPAVSPAAVCAAASCGS